MLHASLIRLDPSDLRCSHASIMACWHADALLKSSSKELKQNVLVDVSPGHIYTQKLQDRFSSIALFFTNRFDGRIIGVKWLPDPALEVFVANIGISHSLQSNRRQAPVTSVRLDYTAALADMACIAPGLIDDVRLLHHDMNRHAV